MSTIILRPARAPRRVVPDPAGTRWLANAFVDAWNGLRAKLPASTVAAAIRRGGPDGLIMAYDMPRWSEGLKTTIANRLRAIAEASARREARRLGIVEKVGKAKIDEEDEADAVVEDISPTLKPVVPSSQFVLDFNLINPYSVTFADQRAGELVVNINEEIQRMIQETVSNAMAGGATADDVARDIASSERIGLLPQHSQAVARYADALSASGADDQAVALDAGRYAQRLLDYRAKNIARTETIQATSAGQDALWHAAVGAGILPAETERAWILTPDEKTCEVCRSLNGQKRGLDEPFETDEGDKIDMPPAHPSCRCTYGLVQPDQSTYQAMPEYDPPDSRDLAP